MSRAGSPVAVCVPTLGRPEAMEALLENLLEQERAPDVVLVVDASDDEGTAEVCARLAGRFADGVLRHVPAERGLTRQRRLGLELLAEGGEVGYVCMLDDDVTLLPDFLARGVAFLESEAGRPYGGISGYDLVSWGRPFEPLERLYSRLGIFEGELRPGRWLYCGRFLEHSRLEPSEGVLDTDFIAGGLTIWRMEVFEDFLPPLALEGYALLEDKHLSLRVATRYRLGVLGSARLRHERAEGGRPGLVGMAYRRVRGQAMLLKDCDPAPARRRYAAFLAVTLLDASIQAVWSVVRLRWRSLPKVAGTFLGWISCLIRPPKPSEDALVHGKVGARGLAPTRPSSRPQE